MLAMAIPAHLQALTGDVVDLLVVDVGANPIDGPAPYAPLVDAGLARVVGFEPNPDALAALHARQRPQDTFLPHAIGDGRRHTLHVCAAPGMTSLLAPNPEVLARFAYFEAWGQVTARVEVDTVRLDDVPETAGASFLKLDIQGAELMALQHATRRLRDAVVVQAEVEFLPMYVGQPLFAEVEQFLRGHGFVLHTFNPLVSRMVVPLVARGNPYAGLRQHLWADAIFVRDFTRPAGMSEDQLLALATILHDCYGSYDVAAHLLAEHDRRTAGDRAARYLAGLSGR